MIVTDTDNISKRQALATMKRMKTSVNDDINLALIITEIVNKIEKIDGFNDLPYIK